MNWTEDIFQIVNRIPRTPVVYEVRDLLERPIEGTSMKRITKSRASRYISCGKSLEKTNKK